MGAVGSDGRCFGMVEAGAEKGGGGLRGVCAVPFARLPSPRLSCSLVLFRRAALVGKWGETGQSGVKWRIVTHA